MNRTRLLCLVMAFVASAATGNAGSLLYTFGDNFGPPFTLSSVDTASASSVNTVNPQVGDGNSGFSGLVYANNLLYTIGNDNGGNATLYSLQLDGLGLSPVLSDFNSGALNNVGFHNGLAAVGSTFYAIGAGNTEDLYQINGGIISDEGALSTLGGTYAGLAWDSSLGEFYAVIANATGDFAGDWLVKFRAAGGPISLVAKLTVLDGQEPDVHLGGLADAGGGILYDIYTDPASGTGILEQIDLNGTPSVSALYDTGIPLVQNSGIATIPEPASSIEFAAGMLLVCCVFRRARIGNRRPT